MNRRIGLGVVALSVSTLSLLAARTQAPAQPQRLWSLSSNEQLYDISPDGRLAAYIDWAIDGDLVVRDLESGITRNLTKKTLKDDEAESAKFSPDGKQILYDWTASKSDSDEFRTIRVDGSGRKSLYRSAPNVALWPAMWTGDGASILLWVTRRDSNRVRLPGSGLAYLPSGGGTPRVFTEKQVGDVVISPDGRIIAGTIPRSDRLTDLAILSATDGSEIARFANSANDKPIKFTRDGLVFTSQRGGSPGIWKQPLVNGKPQGNPHLVRGDLWRLYQHSVYTDTSGRLFYEINAGDRDAYMVNFNAELGRTTSRPIPLSKAPGEDFYDPQFSSDGKYVAMTKHDFESGAQPKVLVRSLTGDEVREIAIGGFARNAIGVEWIPGSQAVVVGIFDSTVHARLLRVDLASGQQRILADSVLTPVAFSNDGGTMYFATFARQDTGLSRIRARTLSSGRERVIYAAPRGDAALASSLSRDGKTLIVAVGHTSQPHPYRLIAVTVATGAVRDLTAAARGADSLNGGPRPLGFSADQSAEIILAPKAGDPAHTLTLWRAPLAGGPATELGPAPKEIEYNQRQASGSWLSPDATRLVFVGGTLKTELWRIDEPAIRAELGTHR